MQNPEVKQTLKTMIPLELRTPGAKSPRVADWGQVSESMESGELKADTCITLELWKSVTSSEEMC